MYSTVLCILLTIVIPKIPLLSYEKPSLRISSSVKETFNTSYEAILKRLKDDQKKVKLRRQKYRAEALLSRDFIVTKSEKNAQVKVDNSSYISNADGVHEHQSDSVSESNISVNTTEQSNQISKPLFDPAEWPFEEDGNSPTIIPPPSSGVVGTQPSLDNDLLNSISNFDKSLLKKK